MPKVPVYYDHAPLQENAYAVRVTAPTGAVAGLDALARDVTQRVSELEEEKNRLYAIDADSQMGDTERDFISEQLKLRGKDAEGATEVGKEWYQAELNKRTSAAENDRQRYLITRLAARRRETGLSVLARHQAQQRDVWADDQLKDDLSRAELAVSTYYSDEEKTKETIDGMDLRIDALLPGRGNDARKIQARSHLRAVQIQSLYRDQPDVALARLEEQQGTMDPDIYQRLRNVINGRLEEKRVEGAYDYYLQAAGGNFEKAINLARSETQPPGAPKLELDQRKKVLSYLRDEFTWAEKARRDSEHDQADAFNAKVVDLWMRGGLSERALADMQVPPHLANTKAHWFGVARADRFRAEAESKAELNEAARAAKEVEKAQHEREYRKLNADVAGMVERGLTRTQLSGYAGILEKEDFNRYWNQIEQVGNARKQAAKDGLDTSVDYLAMAKERAEKTVMADYGDYPTPADKAEAQAKLDTFILGLHNQMRRNKKQKWEPEVMEFADQLLQKTVIKPGWVKDTKGFVFQKVGESKPWLSNLSDPPRPISPEDRQYIVDYLIKRGRKPLEVDIQTLYRQWFLRPPGVGAVTKPLPPEPR